MNSLEKTLIEHKITVLDEDGKNLDLAADAAKEENKGKFFLYIQESDEAHQPPNNRTLFKDLVWTRSMHNTERDLSSQLACMYCGGHYSDMRVFYTPFVEGKEKEETNSLPEVILNEEGEMEGISGNEVNIGDERVFSDQEIAEHEEDTYLNDKDDN